MLNNYLLSSLTLELSPPCLEGKGSTLLHQLRGGAELGASTPDHRDIHHLMKDTMAALFVIVTGIFYLFIDPAHSLNNGKLRSCQFDTFF